MTPQELKNSILQLAIQGKLVEQRPEEGTAEELYRQIQEEKQKLIKEGKIKKEKPLPEITEDEKPFDIPETWKWVRVRDCISNRAGLAYDKTNLSIHSDNMIRVLRGGNISEMKYIQKSDDVFISSEFVKPELFLRRNTIITPAVTSLDHVGKMGRIERDYSDMVVGGFVLMLVPHMNNDVLSRYLLTVFSSKYFRDCCRGIVNKSGQAFYNLSREKMMGLVIPLPPIDEQKRIVAKIEELLPLIDRYEKAWTRLEEFNKRFPDDLQKSLLQMAIQGKLVEQRPEEGTGEELYQQIQKEKQELIRAGKIKKEKPLPEITEDEKPFDIPESWKWVRLKEVSQEIGDGIHGTPIYDENGKYYFVNGNNLVNGKIEIKADTKRVSEEEFQKYKKPLHLTTVLLSINGTIGNFAYYDSEPIILGKSACYITLFKGICRPYLRILLGSKAFYNYAFREATQTTIKNVSLHSIRMFPIPLPPLAEQKRIVAKLEELLPLCEKLKS